MIHIFKTKDILEKDDWLFDLQFKTYRGNDKFLELDAWPNYTTASQAKDYINVELNIPMYLVNSNLEVVSKYIRGVEQPMGVSLNEIT